MTLTLYQKQALRSLLDNPDILQTLTLVAESERLGWLSRLGEAALDVSKNPLMLVEYATRADQWDQVINALRRHAREEKPKET